MRSITVNLSLPSLLLKLIDQKAKEELRTRSELLREAARAYLAHEQRWAHLSRFAQKRAQTLGIRNESDVLRMIDSVRRTSRPSAA